MMKQGAGSTLSVSTFDLGYTAGCDSKKINPRPDPFFVSDLDHRYPPYDEEEATHLKRCSVKNHLCGAANINAIA